VRVYARIIAGSGYKVRTVVRIFGPQIIPLRVHGSAVRILYPAGFSGTRLPGFHSLVVTSVIPGDHTEFNVCSIVTAHLKHQNETMLTMLSTNVSNVEKTRD